MNYSSCPVCGQQHRAWPRACIAKIDEEHKQHCKPGNKTHSEGCRWPQMTNYLTRNFNGAPK